MIEPNPLLERDDGRPLDIVGPVSHDRLPRANRANAELSEHRSDERGTGHRDLARPVSNIDTYKDDSVSALKRVQFDVAHDCTLPEALA